MSTEQVTWDDGGEYDVDPERDYVCDDCSTDDLEVWHCQPGREDELTNEV